MEETFGTVEYSKDKVNGWSNTVIDGCIKELVKSRKKFKYAVTCIIMQKNGAGLQAAGNFIHIQS